MIRSLLLGATLLLLAALAPSAHAGGPIDCTLRFNASGWSMFYKTSAGTGTVSCSNGQRAAVTIRSKGGGLTVGKSRITDGRGEFSGVRDIDDVFGSYVTAEAHAGASRSSKAQVMSKGNVSLALAGTGQGWDLGIAFGRFVISR